MDSSINAIADPTSHDLDSVKLKKADGTVESTRQPYSGFVEVDSGNPLATRDTNFRKAMYDNRPITDVARKGKGIFGRTVANIEVENVDKTLIDFLATDYTLWGNYGLPKKGTPDYDKLKWFDDTLMENNEDAAQLLRDNPDPTTILSDDDYIWVSERVEKLRTAYQSGDYKDSNGLHNVAVELSNNVDKVVGYKQRMLLDDMESDPLQADIIKERGTGSAADIRYQEQKANTSIDIGTRKERGFWAGVGIGAATSWVGSRVPLVHAEYTDKDYEMEEWLRTNKDMDPQFLQTAWNSYANGGSPNAAINEALGEKATYEYQSYLNKADLMSAIGAGIGEFGSNPVNLVLANPIFKGASVVASKLPTIIQPLVTGLSIGATESLVNDFTAGHNLTTEQKTERAAWNAIAGGGILTLIQGSKSAISSYADSVMLKASTPDLVDDVSREVTQTIESNTQSLIRSKAEAGRRLRAQQQTHIDRAGENAYQKAIDETEGLTVPQSKALLKEVYEELGEKGHSKFTTKAKVTEQLAKMRSKQASNEARSQVRLDTIAKDRKAADAQALKEATEQAEAVASTKATDAAKVAEVDAEDALNLAVVNKKRIEDGKTAHTSIDSDGFADDLIAVKQVRALEDAAVDAEKITAALKARNFLVKAYSHLTKGVGLRDMTTKGFNMDDGVVRYAAMSILETGAGYAGRSSRPATAALIKDTINKRAFSNIMGAYQNSMNAWARDKGISYIQNVNARNQGEANKFADEFHKEVYLTQERLAMGDNVTVDPNIQKYLTSWDKEMGDLFKEARDAGVPGFGKNQRKHYQARVWKKGKVANITKIYGDDSVRQLLRESMESAQRKGKAFEGDGATIDELVDRQLNWINGLGDAMTSYKVGVNARTKARMPLDMTVSIPVKGGKQLRMVDLVDTNIPSASATYTQRLSGSIGLAKATKGAVRDEREFALLAEKATTEEAKQFMKDTGDMIFGYPTREGMNPALRMVMDSAQYAQLETLGVAQLATVGTSLQAVVANWVSNPEVSKAIIKMAGGGDNNVVMRQIRERSAVNNNIRYSNRADVNTLDQAQIEDISKYSLAMIAAVDKLTGGNLKSTLNRGLGKLSVYDAIAQYQSKLTQASFTTETARQTVLGNSSFTNERLIDLGVLAIKDGKTVDTKLSKAYKEHVEFGASGELKDMHFEKWTDDQMREYTYSMNRYEAQVMPYIMAGELPQFMNMPEMQFALHYLKTPLAFGTKGTERQLGFGDKQAALAVALNTLSAGLVRYSYVAGIGAVHSALVGEDISAAPDANAMKTHNYLDYLGWMGEGYNKGSAIYNTISDGSVDPLGKELPPAVKHLYNMGTLNTGALPALVPGLPVVLGGIVESIENKINKEGL